MPAPRRAARTCPARPIFNGLPNSVGQPKAKEWPWVEGHGLCDHSTIEGVTEKLRAIALQVSAVERRTGMLDAQCSAIIESINFALNCTLPAVGGLDARTASRIATALERAAHDSDFHILECLGSDISAGWLGSRVNLSLHLGDAAILLALDGNCEPKTAPRWDVLCSLLALPAQERLERMFAFETLLCSDPACVYLSMDEQSKWSYRACVLNAAAAEATTPLAITRTAISLAQSARVHDVKKRHVGYYLCGPGRVKLTKKTPSQATAFLRWSDSALSVVAKALLRDGGVATMAAVAALGAICIAPNAPWQVVLLCAGAIAFDMLGAPFEKILGRFFDRPPLPALNFLNDGLPSAHGVVIAVPTLLIDRANIDRIVDTVSWNWAAANDDNVSIAVIADCPDSEDPAATPAERDLLAYLASSMVELSSTMRGAKGRLLVLFREREYSQTQSAWMGRERKRGKLEELHEIMIGSPSSLRAVVGDIDLLQGLRYVLVIDDDSRLGRDALCGLVAAAAHPLNAATFDGGNRVVSGHVLFAPICLTRKSALRSWRAPSLVTTGAWDEHMRPQGMKSFAHDFFGQGQFAGKGLYDVRNYMRACAGRLPDESILSHDTAEGAWLRPGEVGRAVIVEGVPTSIRALYERQHRWARGDWQNLAYFLGQGWKGSTRIDAFHWYLLLNQLRVQATPVALCSLLLMAVTTSEPLLVAWVFAMMLFPAIPRLIPTPNGKSIAPAITRTVRGFVIAAAFRMSACLHTSLLSIDALVRASWRLASRRNLLEWRSAAQVECDRGSGPAELYLQLSIAAAAVLAIVAVSLGLSVWTTLLVVVPWLALPGIYKLVERVP